MMKNTLKALLATSLLCLSGLATAHAVWLEQDAQGTHLYYGEYDEALRESSPGKLDDIGTPQVFQQGKLVAGKKNAQGWDFSTSAVAATVANSSNSELRAEVTETPVRDWRKQGIGIVKPLYFARYAASSAAQKPSALLDLVPSGNAGEFQLFLQGKALAGVKVSVVAPNGWSREIKTNAEGRITIALPWQGLYVLEATHLINEKGEFRGVSYEGKRARSTLSFQHENGSATFRPTPKAYTK